MTLVACIGCGTVGSAWAVVFARAGHDVVLFDQNQDSLESFSLPLIQETLDLLETANDLTESKAHILGRISTAASLETAVSNADYIQESVSEDVNLKRKLFKTLSKLSRADAILASSTSALKGSDFLTDIEYPERALVAHPVNPPSLIPLVELCGSLLTSQTTLSRTAEFLTKANMKPITLNNEIDGFILNRLQYTLVAEAMHLVGEGYCSAADIDRVMTDGLALRWASIGPFEVAHLNAAKGFQGFVDQLGPMMKTMGTLAKTDYDWTAAQAAAIHEDLEKHTPVQDIPERQNWRNKQILATRAMQARGKIR